MFSICHVVSYTGAFWIPSFHHFYEDLSFEIDDPQKLKMFVDNSMVLVAGRTLGHVNKHQTNKRIKYISLGTCLTLS